MWNLRNKASKQNKSRLIDMENNWSMPEVGEWGGGKIGKED